MKQRAMGRAGSRPGSRRPLQSRSSECLTTVSHNTAPSRSEQERNQVGVGRSRSAEDVLARSLRDREVQPTSHPWEGRHRHPTKQATQRDRAQLCECTAPQRALSKAEREAAVRRMHAEFTSRRKVVLSGLPASCREEDLNIFLRGYSCRTVSNIKDGTVRILFPDSDTAREQMQKLNTSHYEGSKLSASYGHPNSLLFVGNLPYAHSSEDLQRLFQPHGQILRCFIVCSLLTGLSKGYGFVEFASREEASQAKMQLATKVVGQRSLRVDFADNGMQTCEDLHSRTLFVDRLPKGFVDDEVLRELFSKFGIVNFCQVAMAPSGTSRGFAFVDMSTWQEAEEAQSSCSGARVSGHEIRVSFGMPCRPGACILQHKTSITIPFPVAGRALSTAQKENIPVEFVLHKAPSLSMQFVLPSIISAPYKPHPPHLSRADLSPSNASCVPLSSLPPKCVRSSSAPQISSVPQSIPQHVPASTSHETTTSLPHLTPHSSSTAPTPIVNNHIPTQSWNTAEHNGTCTTTRSRKRSAPEPDHSTSDGLMGVYDKPYIGQHQQGIPYTHPLKRIRMEGQ